METLTAPGYIRNGVPNCTATDFFHFTSDSLFHHYATARSHTDPADAPDGAVTCITHTHAHMNYKSYAATTTLVTVTKIIIDIRAGQSGVRMLAEARDFALIQNVHNGSEPPQTSYLIGVGVSSQRKGGQVVMFTTHFHQACRLRHSGGSPLLPHLPS